MATQVQAWRTVDSELFLTQSAALLHEVELAKRKKFNDFFNSPAYSSSLPLTQVQVHSLLARWTLYDANNPDPAP